MKIHRRLIVLFLCFCVFGSGIRTGFYFSFYLFDREDFVREFCENMDKPMMHCDGKCKLLKISKEDRERSDYNTKEIKKELVWVVYSFSGYKFVREWEELERVYWYVNFYDKEENSLFFHPPA